MRENLENYHVVKKSDETPVKVNAEDKKAADTKFSFDTKQTRDKSSIKKEMNLVPRESIKISKEGLYHRENEEV